MMAKSKEGCTGAADGANTETTKAPSVSWAQLQPGEQPTLGVRIYTDGINPDKPQNIFVRLIAQLTLALYTGNVRLDKYQISALSGLNTSCDARYCCCISRRMVNRSGWPLHRLLLQPHLPIHQHGTLVYSLLAMQATAVARIQPSLDLQDVAALLQVQVSSCTHQSIHVTPRQAHGS